MAKKENIRPQKGELQLFSNFVLFQTDNGKVNIDVYFQDETLWLSQKSIAELFEKGRTTITEHLKKIFEEGELEEKLVCRHFRHTTQHGAIEGLQQEKEVKFYNLKAITAVGYRVNSHRATEFRKWATNVLHEYIIKGFAMDDERLKHLRPFCRLRQPSRNYASVFCHRAKQTTLGNNRQNRCRNYLYRSRCC